MPAKEWLEQWEQVKDKSVPPVDLNAYFEQSQIATARLDVMDIGPCSLPSGQVLVRDPFVYLVQREEKPYFFSVPAGTYRTEVCVVKPDGEGDCARYAAVRLRFSESRPVHFYEALVGDEDLSELDGDMYFGFNVDAGLGCICDKEVHQAFCDWWEQWHRENPGKEYYNDYFSPLFEKSYQEHPEYQRVDGDWINWQIPGTDYHLPIFQSGFGDGAYPVYWGFDENGNICQLVIFFIDIEQTYCEEE